MELGYTFFYIESNIVCIFIFAMLLLRNLGGVDRQEQQRVFDGMLISYIMYFISDILWVLILDNRIPKNEFSVSSVNLCNAILLSLITYFWFVYVEMSQGEQYLSEVRNRVILFLPAVASFTTLVVMFAFFRDVLVDEQNDPTATYYILFIFVPVIYILAAAVRSITRALKKENFANRKTYLACGIYPIAVSISGVLQTMWLKAPLFCFGCTITMVYVYIVSLENMVSTDPLTNLNNRAQLRRFISNESMRVSEEGSEPYVMMVDLNKFKSINDKYGHVEGDNAIIRTADALRQACSGSRLRPFIARYGGDEFIVIARSPNEAGIRDLGEKIKRTLSEMNAASGVRYELTASVGYAPYKGDAESFQQALRKADEALYRDKEKHTNKR